MKIGDKVIINPNIPLETWSKYGYSFHDSMRKPGVFTLDKQSDIGGFQIGDYLYDEEWLLPVPLYNVGDTVKIRKDLSQKDNVPFSVSLNMQNLAGQSLTIKRMRFSDLKQPYLGYDGYLYELSNDNGNWSWSSPMFDLSNYKLKFKSYESRLQEQESPLRGGSREFTGGICCRKHKPRVTVQSISYKEVIGRG